MVLIVIFWILYILAVLALFFGSAYPLLGAGMFLVLIGILGLRAFGSPLQ